MTIDLPGGAGGRRDMLQSQRYYGLKGGVQPGPTVHVHERHGSSDRETRPRAYVERPMVRNLEPREADVMARSKMRAMVGTVPAQGRSTFAITSGGSTRGLVEHQTKRVGRP